MKWKALSNPFLLAAEGFALAALALTFASPNFEEPRSPASVAPLDPTVIPNSAR